jgi:hypothetical protein
LEIRSGFDLEKPDQDLVKVVEIAAKIHNLSMQFPQYNCRVLYPRVSSLYETDLRSWSNLKGTVSRDFRPLVFSSNITPGSTDSRAKAVSNIGSYSQRYSTLKIDYSLCSIERSQFFLDNCQFTILFYCHGVGKITYGDLLMTYCSFNICYKSAVQKKLCAMMHSSESRLFIYIIAWSPGLGM